MMTAWAHLNSGLLGRGAGKILRNRVVVGAVVLFIAIGPQCITSHYYDPRLRREMQAKAQALKNQIDRRFPHRHAPLGL